jgi:hypothetical protein
MELEKLKGANSKQVAEAQGNVKSEVQKVMEDRKDERVKKQAVEQSKLISQRKGDRGELEDNSVEEEDDFLQQFINNG